MDQFGGALLKGNPKRARPMDSKLPLHLVLRARNSSMRRPSIFGKVNRTAYETAEKYGVKIFSFANVGNHLHLVIRVTNLKLWAPFIRELTGRIAMCANPKAESGGFWLYRPYTRIIRSWKKAFRSLLDYVFLNRLEADGHINRAQIRTFAQLKLIFGNSC